MSKDAWYRPLHDVVGFIPPSPGGELLAGLQRIVREEGQKIGMKIKLVEQTGVSVRALLTKPDLSGCLYPQCEVEEDGASHSQLHGRVHCVRESVPGRDRLLGSRPHLLAQCRDQV